jgi:hypothetical protein
MYVGSSEPLATLLNTAMTLDRSKFGITVLQECESEAVK